MAKPGAKPRRKRIEGGLTTVAEALEKIDLPKLPEPEPGAEAARMYQEEIARKAVVPEDKPHVERSGFMKAPEGWIPAFSSSAHGIQVNKLIADSGVVVRVGIQFAEEPPRPVKDAVEIAGFSWPESNGRRQWEQAGGGQLLIDAKRLAAELAPMLENEMSGRGR